MINSSPKTNNYTIQASTPACGIPTKVLDYEVFTLVKAILPDNMFTSPGHLDPNSLGVIGNFGFIEFLNVEERIVNYTTFVDIDTCIDVPAIAQIKQLDLIITIGYSEVLYNKYNTPNPDNNDAILGTNYNFTTIKVDGFRFAEVDEDVSSYRNPKNYTLSFNLTAAPDMYAPDTMPLVGVVCSGDVTVNYVNP